MTTWGGHAGWLKYYLTHHGLLPLIATKAREIVFQLSNEGQGVAKLAQNSNADRKIINIFENLLNISHNTSSKMVSNNILCLP